jgi:hypothetical protein
MILYILEFIQERNTALISMLLNLIELFQFNTFFASNMALYSGKKC